MLDFNDPALVINALNIFHLLGDVSHYATILNQAKLTMCCKDVLRIFGAMFCMPTHILHFLQLFRPITVAIFLCALYQ